MPRLVPNPLSELVAPINRLEAAVGRLEEQISGVGVLPEILAEFRAARQVMESSLEEVRLLRAEFQGMLNGRQRG